MSTEIKPSIIERYNYEYCPINSAAKCHFNFSKEVEKKCFIAMAYKQFHSKDIEKMLRTSTKNIIKAEPILAKDIKKIKSSIPVFCETVCRPIKESHYCIIDITYHSVNVGIECGIALQMGKDVILTKYTPKRSRNIKDKEEDMLEYLAKDNCIQYFKLPTEIPTDIALLTIIHYKNQRELNDELKKKFPSLKLSRTK